jgi:Cu(I)/Ag(I) efflux system membrane protein CusA/SilA
VSRHSRARSGCIPSPLGIQVFGANLAEIERASIEIERASATVPGTRGAFADRSTGGFYVDIVVNGKLVGSPG